VQVNLRLFRPNLALVDIAEGRVVTNDPGTRKGEEYQYAPDVLLNAIHDWNGSGDTIEEGRKAMIVVYPN